MARCRPEDIRVGDHLMMHKAASSFGIEVGDVYQIIAKDATMVTLALKGSRTGRLRIDSIGDSSCWASLVDTADDSGVDVEVGGLI